MWVVVFAVSRHSRSLRSTFCPKRDSARETAARIGNLWGRQIPVAERSKARVCSRPLAGVAASNPTGGMDVCRDCFLLPGRGLCDGPISRSEEFYRLWSAIVCDSETSRRRRPWPALGCCAGRRQNLERRGTRTFKVHIRPVSWGTNGSIPTRRRGQRFLRREII
jgi:hypothetical protein